MKFLLGWGLKLGFLGVVYLAMTGGLQLKLPETVLGFEVPAEARQWVDRNGKINELAGKTQSGFKGIADAIR